jgi:hypothetical protein
MQPCAPATLTLALTLLTVVPAQAAAADRAAGPRAPALWGYGVKSCRDFLAAAPAAAPDTVAGEEYRRYREWLAGLVSGLNLATGADVLDGAELEAALTRIRAHCEGHQGEDFFNASLALLKGLGRREGGKP